MSPRSQAPCQPQRRAPREETRQRLLEAALAAFADHGFAKTSVEHIVARAGYTRGAFYSNFPDKDALFFALMDERMENRVSEVATVLAASSPESVIENLRSWSEKGQNESAGLRATLSAEFRSYALRNPEAKAQLQVRERRLRSAFASAISAEFAAIGVTPPAPAEDLALIVQTLDSFLPLQRELDPESVREGFMFDALALLLDAGAALAAQRAR